jgi:L-amino acid N-acyltransferase YncA
MTVPPSAVTIRPATDADMDAVAAIYAHHVRHGRASFETEPPTAAEMRRRRADVVGKGLPYLVAAQDLTAQAGMAAQAGVAETGCTRSGDTRWGDSRSGDTHSRDTHSGNSDSGDTRWGDTLPGRTPSAGLNSGSTHSCGTHSCNTAAAEVVGYAYAGIYRPRPAYANTVENSVYLRPDMVGRGIGRRLLSALIAACEQGGLRQMVAVVGDSANTASIRLHEALGFRRVGVLRDVGYKHGVWLDSVLLQRSLGPGSATPPGRADG